MTSFEGPLNIADNYDSRIRRYICPPQIGNYTFWIATDEAGELWLSTDDDPVNKVRIAYVDSYTDYREWSKFSSQKSAAITLQAGKKYYVEALQKESGGGDNLSVRWHLPDGTTETPIAGNHLSPFVVKQLQAFSLNLNSTSKVDSTSSITANELLSEAHKKTGLFVYPNPVSNQTTVEFTLPDSGQTSVALYNTKGQFIHKLFTGITEANTTNSFVLDAETLKNGIYIINLRSGKNSLTKKLVVVN